MLILTRKAGERIFIGDNITITIVRADQHSVRIGIDAPKDVTILREEVARRNTDNSNRKEGAA